MRTQSSNSVYESADCVYGIPPCGSVNNPFVSHEFVITVAAASASTQTDHAMIDVIEVEHLPLKRFETIRLLLGTIRKWVNDSKVIKWLRRSGKLLNEHKTGITSIVTLILFLFFAFHYSHTNQSKHDQSHEMKISNSPTVQFEKKTLSEAIEPTNLATQLITGSYHQFEKKTPSGIIEPTKLATQLITESSKTFEKEVVRVTSQQTHRSAKSLSLLSIEITSQSIKVVEEATEITASTKFDPDGIWNAL